MKKLFTLLACLLMLTTRSEAQVQLNSLPNQLQIHGCWYNPDTQEWLLGLFNNFAVYEDDIWLYQSTKAQKNKAEITLRKGNESKTIKLKLSNKQDSTCTAVFPDKRQLKLIRRSAQPEFKSKDHRTFTDNGYCTDSVTIIGYLQHAKRTVPFFVGVSNFYSREQDTYYADIDAQGCFRITFPVVNTTTVFMDWQREGVRIQDVVEPGEKIFLYHDYATNKTQFMGKNARLHTELRNFALYPPNREHYIYARYDDKTVSHEGFMQKLKDNYKKKVDILKEYMEMHPMLSDRFIQYEESGSKMELAFYLMQRRFSLQRGYNKEFFDKPYMDYVDSLYHCLPQPYTLHRNVSSFLADYLGYYNSMLLRAFIFDNIELLHYLDREQIQPLTQQQKEDFLAYEHAVELSINGKYSGKDSLEIDSLALPYKEGMLRTDKLLNDSNTIRLCNQYKSVIPFLLDKKRIDNELICFGQIEATPILKEWIATQNFYANMEYNRKELDEKILEYFKQLVTHKEFRSTIMERQEMYAELSKQDISHPESLKATDHLKDCKDVDELWRTLIEPYKGKVIYVDVWGTWCGPCKKEMQLVAPIKDEMKEKDVIFMYFANYSPEKTWKNCIKEFRLTGPNIVHYNLPAQQQQMLEQKFSIRSFPTYMLIDKEGNITDMKAPSPSRKAELISRVDELLAK
ncbi:TlpA family protein disulfide reductase [Bacteroides sp. UBA939]|uniref:TlpA family protein disulfide reductase n=1 Tax=Bacteroides sp. UBA939 TaxID=1946092 RepID=UPI0025BD6C66|nr:TlpA disulfide reductase family protein [Bacteroides sp. UBA939]